MSAISLHPHSGKRVFLHVGKCRFEERDGLRVPDTDDLGAGRGSGNTREQLPSDSNFILQGRSGIPHFLDGKGISSRTDHGHGEIRIALEGREADPFHGRIRILKAVPERPGVRVDDDMIALDADLPEEDVELFCKIDIDGRLGQDRMVVGKGCCRDAAIPSGFSGTEKETLPLASFAAGLEYFAVDLRLVASFD